jgi:gas vesicle protein
MKINRRKILGAIIGAIIGAAPAMLLWHDWAHFHLYDA